MDFTGAILKKALNKLPFKPLIAWRELTPESRGGLRVLAELAAAARELGPIEPPAELWQLYLQAGVEFNVPAELLAAIAAEGLHFDAATRDHFMGLPIAIAAELSQADQVRQVAKALSAFARLDGMGAALVKYCGSRELAGHVAGSAALMLARKTDLSADDVSAAFDFLEDK